MVNPERLRSYPQKESKESSPFALRVRAIAIGGSEGTGKSTLAERLGKLYKVPVVDVGTIFREIAEKKGTIILDYFSRDPRVDRMIDLFQQEILEKADPSHPVILLSRIAPVLGKRLNHQQSFEISANSDTVPEIQEIIETYAEKTLGKDWSSRKPNQNPDQVCVIGITADKDEANDRIFKRVKPGKPDLTLEQSAEQTASRHKKDLDRLHKVHPRLKGIDPSDPNCKDIDGIPIYERVVDTTNLSIEKMIETAHEVLLEDKCVVQKANPRQMAMPWLTEKIIKIFKI